MKTTLKVAALILLGLLFSGGGTGPSQAKAAPDWGIEGGVDFYSTLSPYGEWVDVTYGRAWRPYNTHRGWRPYLEGRWMWTDDGWYWSSYEPFGWATYHYGRWTYDDYYGWVWIPDNVWGPSWVEWRYNDDYIGWAPLSPYAEFGFGFGIRYRSTWIAPVHYWNFVPCRNFTATRVSQYIAPIERSRRFFGSTRGSNRIEADGERVINRGVDRGFIERRGNVRIERSDIVTGERNRGEQISRGDGGRERIEVYRPRIEHRSGERDADIRNDRNNSGGRTYNDMHGIPQTDQRRESRNNMNVPDRNLRPNREAEQPRPDQNRIERRQEENRRTVETPDRWRQRMPESRPAPSMRSEPRMENRGGSGQPERSRQTAPEGRRGGGRRP